TKRRQRRGGVLECGVRHRFRIFLLFFSFFGARAAFAAALPFGLSGGKNGQRRCRVGRVFEAHHPAAAWWASQSLGPPYNYNTAEARNKKGGPAWTTTNPSPPWRASCATTWRPRAGSGRRSSRRSTT